MGQTKAPASITDRVLMLMALRRVSAAELARRLGWTQQYISRRLRDEVPWRAEDLRAVAIELGGNVAELIS